MHSILERKSSVGTSRENTYSKPEINALQASISLGMQMHKGRNVPKSCTNTIEMKYLHTLLEMFCIILPDFLSESAVRCTS